MKKYLMTGIAALSMCAAFTSCSNSDDIEVYTQAQIDKAKYDQAFLKYVGGTIAADQDWGFSANITAASRVTRSINVNGNLWKDCPTVGTKEETDVVAYLSTLQTKQKNPVNLDNYFVTQIHKGDEDYYNQDHGYVGVGSDKMNNLHIAMTSSASINAGALSGEGPSAWEHINNFNAGNCTDWSAGSDNHGNTMVIAGGTYDFAYEGAEDSKYHNRWCSIDGKNVPRTDGVADNYDGYYYICFDFEQSATARTVIKFRNPEKTPLQGYVKGSFDKTKGIDQVKGMTVYYEEYDETVGKNVEKTFEWTVGQAGTSEWTLDNVINGNQMVNPNDSYKDWIIRLVKAEPEETYDIRIMGEDLSAAEAGDFDFNDVVIDVKFSKAGETTTKLCLRAAGGRLPLIIADDPDWEVHKLFGVDEDYMVNTGAGDRGLKGNKKKNPIDAVELTLEKRITNAAEANTEIPLKVFKNNEWQEMTAKISEPAAKIAVPAKGGWLDEKVSIKDVKTKFVDWASQNKSRSTWWTDEE